MNHHKMPVFAAAYTVGRAARFLFQTFPPGHVMERGWASAANYLLLISCYQ